ncbi:MAG: hypothetical protein MZV49_08010 [Rhodopseudomonas palustris]|nr:hypothetical protein [Rhodopseudomonas palustris]
MAYPQAARPAGLCGRRARDRRDPRRCGWRRSATCLLVGLPATARAGRWSALALKRTRTHV